MNQISSGQLGETGFLGERKNSNDCPLGRNPADLWRGECQRSHAIFHNKESQKNQGGLEKRKKAIRKLLIKFITRIPIFMCLTDHREEKLRHVIEALDPDLFEKTTGVSIEGFGKLCEAGVFNEANLSAATLTFRLYEIPSLTYIGGTKESQVLQTWGGSLGVGEAKAIINQR